MQKEKKRRDPIREFKVNLSQDGKYFLFKDTTVWVIPRNYVLTIDKNGSLTKVSKTQSEMGVDPEKVGEGNDRTH